MSRYNLRNKNIIITGSSSGIGREIVKILIEKYDCKVLGISRNEERAIEFAKSLNSLNYSYYCFDVGVEAEWQRFSNYLYDKSFYPDLIINNAGVLPRFCAVSNIDVDVFTNTMQTDFWSAVYCVKYLDEILSRSNDAGIVNISSSSALATLVGTAPYTSAKTALRSFTECYGVEQRGKKFVSVVCPGFTKTDIFRSQKQGINEGIIGKISTPVEKMARKIIRGIRRKRRRMVFGFDAKIMNFLYKIAPQKSSVLFSWVMKKSKLKLFDEIFENKTKNL